MSDIPDLSLDWKDKQLLQFTDTKHVFRAFVSLALNSCSYLCRGESKYHPNFYPTLARRNDPKLEMLHEGVLMSSEVQLLLKFRQWASAHLSANELKLTETIWGTQILMRHYLAPTRLVDWTYSPFVALYFACRTDPKEDGWVYVFDIDGIRDYTHSQNVYPERLGGLLRKYFEARRINEMEDVLYGEDIEEYGRKHDSEEPEEPWLFFCHPSRTSERILAQQSVFTIGSPIKQDHMKFLIDHTDNNSRYCYQIPSEMKNPIMRALHAMNITAATLFPDLGGVGEAVQSQIHYEIPTIIPVDDW